LKDLQEQFQQNKQMYEERIADLSNKLKTLTDRQKESTALFNNDIKTKKQQIEQYAQQIEQILNEKTQMESDISDLQRQVS
jgi:predicted  nucleic acid-binding Zn-ribbon protein